MASGWQTTSSLADSLDDIKSSARSVREYEGVVQQLVDRKTLGVGIGESWREVTLTQLTAQAITETTELDNPQRTEDSVSAITPNMVGLEVFVTDRMRRLINRKVIAEYGALQQNAIERLKDEQGLTLFASGATTCEPGAGNTITVGHIAAATYNITSNTTEPGKPPIYFVGHGFQIKDLWDELVAGVGTYIVTEGPTARVLEGTQYELPIAGCKVYQDGNITVDGLGDATAAVFPREAIVLVQGRAPRIVIVRNEKRGGGGDHIYHYDEYAYAERSVGNWMHRMRSDATAPTS